MAAPDAFPLALLASLLHDIGKFWQRTGERHHADFNSFGDADYGRHGAHAKWSADFIQRAVPVAWRAAGSGALYHHRPRDYLSKLVAAADWLSSGERDDVDADAGAQAAQLRSVFSRISLDEGAPAPTPHHYLLEPLTPTERALFPRADVLSEADRRAAYGRLWQGFQAELARIPARDFDAYFETLYSLLQKYTWAVPSAFYRSVPDVSLYDHARTTCAIAAALYRAGTPEAELDALLAAARNPAAWQAKRLLLLGGDITGVQAFLYTVTAKGAARGLRGRSFYLQIVGEAIARWLLRRLELPVANLLYVGGGRFYVLSHLLDESQLAGLRRELDEALLRCHRGDLYVALGAVALSANDLRLGEGFGQTWARLGQDLNSQKRRKFSALPPADLHRAIFDPQGEGGPQPGCVVCGREGPYEDDAPQLERKCALCTSLEELGAELRDAAYLYLGRVEPSLPPGPARSYQDALRAFGVELRLFESGAHLRRQAPELRRGTLLALKSSDFLDEAPLAAAERAGSGLALGFSLLANVTPRRDGAIAEFADLAKAARGVRRLGILRMDVDDLGAIFGRGLGAAATLSRVASLSFLLRLYFEGWLAELAGRHNEAGAGRDAADHVYVIYSGGDDLFVVGSWDRIPRLACEIQRDFGCFAGNNPDLHLSGGIAVEDEHFPLYQAAEHAGEALDRAKARQVGGRVVKDALDFLGQTASWSDVAAAARRTDALIEMVEQGGAPRALVQNLRRIHGLYEDARNRPRRTRGGSRSDQVPYGRWMWLSAYYLSRMADGVGHPWNVRIRDLQGELLRPDGMHILGIAARWAELLLRKEE